MFSRSHFLFGVWLALAGLGLGPAARAAHYQVFLVAGQSNADGRGEASDLTGSLSGYAGTQTDTWIYYSNTGYTNSNKASYRKWVQLRPGFSVKPGYTGSIPSGTFGMEVSAGKELAKLFPNTPVAIIKTTRGATTLTVTDSATGEKDWDPETGTLYAAFITAVQTGLAQLTQAGHTYTVHALFWHQGESDKGNTSGYLAGLTHFISRVRADLALPDLPLFIGELAQEQAASFREVQWQAHRAIPNAFFTSSKGFYVWDGTTHFDAASQIKMGQRFVQAFTGARGEITFEAPIYAQGELDRQDGWSVSATAGVVVATAAQGEYAGGQAAGHTDASGAVYFVRRGQIPLRDAHSMEADFFAGDAGYDNQADADSSLQVFGWRADTNGDDAFSGGEGAVGFGLHNDNGAGGPGVFKIQTSTGILLATAYPYKVDRWYRLRLSWSDPDGAGVRTVSLFGRDLKAGSDLNGGAAILTVPMTDAEFGGHPSQWRGMAMRATRGLIDRIGVQPRGFVSWTMTRYPTLQGIPTQDSDGDGVVDILEYAFGSDPTVPEKVPMLPIPRLEGSNLVGRFVAPNTVGGIRYEAEFSSDLTNWSPVVDSGTNGEHVFSLQTGGPGKGFLRYRATLVPF